jgi:carboxypeptidase family protein
MGHRLKCLVIECEIRLFNRMMMCQVKSILLALLLGSVCGSISCLSNASAQTPPNIMAATGILRGKVTMGPTMPVERAGGAPAIAPVAGASVNVTSASGVPIASAITGADGAYRIAIAPGDYLVTVTPPRRMFRSIVPQQVTVASGAPTVLDITLDTGIR